MARVFSHALSDFSAGLVGALDEHAAIVSGSRPPALNLKELLVGLARCPGRLDEATHCLGQHAGNVSSALALLMELAIVIGQASPSALRDATGVVPGDRDRRAAPCRRTVWKPTGNRAVAESCFSEFNEP